MGFILKKVSIENFQEHNILYSRLVRGELQFSGELHMLNGGKVFQLYLYREHPRVMEFIDKCLETNQMKESNEEIVLPSGVLRLSINDKNFMVNSSGNTIIKVKEYNFNPKDINIVDFPNGKVAILIEFNFENEIDNSKVKKELKDYLMEDIDETGDIG